MKLSNQFRKSCRRYHAAGFAVNAPGRHMVFSKLIKRFGHTRVMEHARQIAEALSNIENEVRYESQKTNSEISAERPAHHTA